MTATEIIELKRKRHEARVLEARQEREMKALKSDIRQCEDNCDHTYPDGTTAYVGGMFMTVCQICGDNDL